MVLMPYSTTGLELALTAGVLIGIGLSGTAFGIVYSAVGRTFPVERRGFALGVVGALGGLGQFVMLPYNQFLISNVGWASALIVLSATCALMIPLSFGMVESQAAISGRATTQSLADAMREAFRHSGFWLVTAGFLTCGFQLAFITTHLPAYLADQGLSANVAVTALAVVALANILGTYLCGEFAGRYRQKYILSGLYFLRGLALLGFVAFPVTPWSTYVFAAAMGVLWLGTVPLTNALVGRIFGMQYVATLFGFVFLSHQIGSFFGVWLGGALFDRTGSYDVVWILAIGLSVLAAAVNFPVDDREIVRRRVVPA
jgi:MFS family permease